MLQKANTEEPQVAPAVKFGNFIEEIRIKRGHKTRVAGAKAIGMLKSTYSQIIVGTRLGKPNQDQLAQFKTGFSMTPDELARCDELSYAQYKNCKYWPDLSITDKELEEIDNLHGFISKRLVQIGKTPGDMAKALGWRSSQLSMLKNSNVPSYRLSDDVIATFVNGLCLNGSLKLKIETLNAARPSLEAMFAARAAKTSAKLSPKPDTSIKDKHLIACDSLPDFISLALKRKGMTQAELQRQTFDGIRDFYYEIRNGDISYRLCDPLIERISNSLSLSAYAKMHLMQINAQRHISAPRGGFPDSQLTKGHVLAADNFTDCIKIKAMQQGVSLRQVAMFVDEQNITDWTYKTIEHALLQGRGTQVTTEFLNVVAQHLEMDEDETRHLLDLNASLRTLYDHRHYQKTPQDIGLEDLLSCPTFSTYLNLKLKQLGMNYETFGGIFGRKQDFANKIINGHRVYISGEQAQEIIEGLQLEPVEAAYVTFLCEIYTDMEADVEAAQEQGNMLKAFLAHNCPECDLSSLSQAPILGRHQETWDVYLNFGFPDNQALQIVAKMNDLSEEKTALLFALNRAHRSTIKPSAKRIESVFETQDLFEALMLKASEAGKGLSSIAFSLGHNINYAGVRLSNGSISKFLKANGGASVFRMNDSSKVRGLEAHELEKLFSDLAITDLNERRYLAVLNGMIWENHRKKRFEAFDQDDAKRKTAAELLGINVSDKPITQPAYSPYHDLIPVDVADACINLNRSTSMLYAVSRQHS